MRLFSTKEWNGVGECNYFWNEYRQEGKEVVKYRCHRYKKPEAQKYSWGYEEKFIEAWNLRDRKMPEWLKEYIIPEKKRCERRLGLKECLDELLVLLPIEQET